MHEAVFASTVTTPARYHRTARRLGYDGLILLDSLGDDSMEPAVRTDTDPQLWTGVSVRATDRGEVSAVIDRHRNAVDVIRCETSDAEMARFIAEQERVDVLALPHRSGGGFSHTMAKAARDAGIYVELSLASVLRSTGTDRQEAISWLHRTTTICDQYDVPIVLTAGASSHLELRTPDALLSVGASIGLDRELLQNGIEAWEELLTRTAEARDESIVEPGVRIEEDNADHH